MIIVINQSRLKKCVTWALQPRNLNLIRRAKALLFLCYNYLQRKIQLKRVTDKSSSNNDSMPFRGDICQYFNSTVFRHYLRKRYKRPETFAKRIGVSFQAVYKWRSGKSKPTWRHLIKIAEILKIAPRLLIIPSQRHILDRWEDHLIDYLEAPPEIKHETTVTIKDGKGSSDTQKSVKRELKLSEKGAIELTEKLGHFPVGVSEDDTQTDTSKEVEMHKRRYAPPEDEDDDEDELE